MKNLKSTKSRVILSLAFLLVLFGGLIPTLGIFSGGKQSARANTGWQLQELWHSTPVTPPDPNASTRYANDLTYSSGKIYGGFTYICPWGFDGQVCTTTNGFDVMTGATVWQKNIGAYYTAPLVANGKIYSPLGDSGLQVYDATNDQLPELWQGQGSTAAINNGVIYTHVRGFYAQPTDGFYSYDASTGQTKWQQLDATCDYGPKVEVYNNIVYYIGCGTDYHISNNITYWVDARSPTDGSVIWSKNLYSSTIDAPVPGYNSTLISNGSIFVAAPATDGSNTPAVASYSTTDGSSKWNKTLSDTTGTNSPYVAQIIASGSTVYVLVDDGENYGGGTYTDDAYALDGATGNEIWHHSVTQNLTGFYGYPLGTLVNSVLYVNYNSAIYAWDGTTGNQLMMDDSVATSPGNASVSTPLVVGNVMYITRENTAVSPYQYTLYAYNIIGQQPPPTEPSVTLSVSIDDMSCLSTLTFSVQNAKPDQIRVSRDGQFITKLAGSAKTYTDVATGTFAGYAYELYEVAAFKNGKFLALARHYTPIDQSCFNGKTPPDYPKPPIADSQNDLFFIVGGINSTLSANAPINSTDTQTAGNNGYGYDPAWETYDSSPRIASYLMWNGYINSRFIMFSYSNNATTYTNDGMPKAFTCKNTFDNWTSSTFFQQEVLALSKQVQAAVAGRTNVRLHILAHSQGGVLALAYAFALAKNLDGVTPLPAGVTLHDIDLNDSPVGGTRYNSDYLTNILLKLGCLSASKFNDVKQMHALFLTAADKTEYGKSASIVGTFFGLNPTDPNNSNQAVAAFTHQVLGVTIFIPGNDNDYLWKPHDCGGGANFRSTENLINDEANGIESRRFTSTLDVLGCVASESNTLNHLDVLLDPNVQQATLQVVQGVTPGLTPYAG